MNKKNVKNILVESRIKDSNTVIFYYQVYMLNNFFEIENNGKMMKFERRFTNFKQKMEKENQRKKIKVGGNIRGKKS